MARRPARQAGDPEQQPGARAPLSALKPLLPFALRYRGRIAAACLALIIASAATLALPLAVRRVIDHGFSVDGAGLIDSYFAVLLLVVAVLALASATRFYLVSTLGERVVADLRAAVFRHLTRLDAGFYDVTKSGEVTSRLTADTTMIKSAFGASASVALRNLVLFLGAVAMMVITSPRLSSLVLIAIPIIVLPLVASGRGVRHRSRIAQDKLAAVSAYATEAVGAVRVMQAFNAEEATAARFTAAAEETYEAARASITARAILTAIALFLVSASVVGVLWYGAQDVLAGRMTGGRLSQFVIYAVLAASSLGELSQVWGDVSQAAGAAGRLAELLATKPAVTRPERPVALPEPSPATVAFQNVRFAYPTRSDVSSLDGLSFSIRRGERVALVGPSGAGKSTVIQLLLRAYDPQVGRVSVDGVDVAAADPAAVRSRIAFVPQDPVVFGTTIIDNIRYGRPDADEAAVREAAQFAAADAFIRALPQGYDSLVGERGVTLSGGQRQRIAIARAVLKDAPILVLDEATSALDAENEQLVQQALDRLMAGRTTLVVAHRLATVLSADRILVLDQGRIVEEGTHQTLVTKGGLYARLARLQFSERPEMPDAPIKAIGIRQ
ncbi:ABC transporter transmembrane domain-containing protein [Chelatococcus sp. GCM10030263]|uniref:ABC transporter transmembrane domain-containing protein n=1 Tax=Chelatococcus sp. GCM10030263 TaxID=3273387 RepID=UPI00360E7172